MANNNKPKHKKKVGNYPYFTVVFSVTISLLVIGLLALVYQIGSSQAQAVEQVQLNVYLGDYVKKIQVTQIESILKDKPYIEKQDELPRIEYRSKEEATREYLDSEGAGMTEEDIINTAGYNPIPARFHIWIDKPFTDTLKLQQIKSELEKLSGVREVDISLQKKQALTKLKSNLNTIRIVLALIVLVSMIVVIILINNTVKLALFSQRFLIRSMQLVGATNSFIRRPFVMYSFGHGLLAGLIASGLLFGLTYKLDTWITSISLVDEYFDFMMFVFSVLCLFGALLCALSTFFSVNRYLKLSLDELY